MSSILWKPKPLNFTEVFKYACGFRTAAKTALLLFWINLHFEDVFVATAHLLMLCLFVFDCGKSWTDSKTDETGDGTNSLILIHSLKNADGLFM